LYLVDRGLSLDKTDKILHTLKSRPQPLTPIASDMFIPNHSGDLSAGNVLTTPTTDYDVVNKKYVDTAIAAAGGVAGANTNVQYNDSGAFGGDSGLTYTKASNSLYVAGFINIPTTTGASVGTIKQNGRPILHTYGGDGKSLFIGDYAGNFTNTDIYGNLAIGYAALYQLGAGYYNTAIGRNALYAVVGGSLNFGIGNYAFSSIVSGEGNVGVGNLVGQYATGYSNLGIGNGAMRYGGAGSNNVGLGEAACYSFGGGYYNVGVGCSALEQVHDVHYNTSIGHQSFKNLVSGEYNFGGGYRTGYGTTGGGNVLLGANVGYTDAGSNHLIVDNRDADTAALLYGTFHTTLSSQLLTINAGTTTHAGICTATQFRLSALNTAPANSGDTGTTGEIRIVNGYIYVCVAANTWQRAAIATW
jgi:hypothetical protein